MIYTVQLSCPFLLDGARFRLGPARHYGYNDATSNMVIVAVPRGLDNDCLLVHSEYFCTSSEQTTRIMLSRSNLRSARNVRRSIAQSRFNSSTAAKSGGSSGAIVGGVAGGLVAFGVGYGFYHFSGAKAAVNTASDMKKYYDDAKNKLAEKTPGPKEALKYIRNLSQSYAAFIPGAKPVLDAAFDDLDKVSHKHGDKVDKLVTDTYHELKDVSKEGLSIETATKAWSILEKKFEEIKTLAKDVGGDLLQQHPELKDKVGGKLDDLKSMAEQYGPDAKKQYDEVYKKVQDIATKGPSAGSLAEVTKLVNDKYTELKKKGEEAYSAGFEKSVAPLLQKYPEAKKFVESNKDALKSGNIEDLIKSVKKAVDSKDLGALQEYADKAKSMASKSGFDLEKYFQNIPNGSDIISKIKELKDAAEKHGDEAKDLSEKTFNEIKEILSKRASEASKIAEKAKKDAQ